MFQTGKKRIKSATLVALAASFMIGCNSAAGPDSTETAATATSTAGAAAKNDAAAQTGPQKATQADPAGNPDKARSNLIGTYTITEVEHDGQIDIISSANTTEIIFTPEGNFARRSRRGGQQDYNDSGTFRIEGRDKLVLTIQMSRHKIVNPPVEKRHTFTISPDGEELKMQGNDGKVAVFRRMSGTLGK